MRKKKTFQKKLQWIQEYVPVRSNSKSLRLFEQVWLPLSSRVCNSYCLRATNGSSLRLSGHISRDVLGHRSRIKQRCILDPSISMNRGFTARVTAVPTCFTEKNSVVSKFFLKRNNVLAPKKMWNVPFSHQNLYSRIRLAQKERARLGEVWSNWTDKKSVKFI